jgi:hypothetical protein
MSTSTDWYRVALAKLNWVEVTLWYRMIDGYQYNHLEDGHNPASEPTPKSETQKKAWAGGKWSKKLWYAQPVTVLHTLPTG